MVSSRRDLDLGEEGTHARFTVSMKLHRLLAFPETCHCGQLSTEGICRQKENCFAKRKKKVAIRNVSFCVGEKGGNHSFRWQSRLDPDREVSRKAWEGLNPGPSAEEPRGQPALLHRLQLSQAMENLSYNYNGVSLHRKTVLFHSDRHTEKSNDKNNDQKEVVLLLRRMDFFLSDIMNFTTGISSQEGTPGYRSASFLTNSRLCSVLVKCKKKKKKKGTSDSSSIRIGCMTLVISFILFASPFPCLQK